MKRIKYTFLSSEIKRGEETEKVFIHKDFAYFDGIMDGVMREAYNGEYEIYDDGQPEPIAEPTPEERIAELEEALALLLSGVTE